jgi:hypothetical protein
LRRKLLKQTREDPFEVAPLSHEVAAARNCGRKPAESETKKIASREAATAIGRAARAAAASRLKIIFCLVPVGLRPRPRLRAAIASRFRKCATSKLTLRVTMGSGIYSLFFKLYHYPTPPYFKNRRVLLDLISDPMHNYHFTFLPRSISAGNNGAHLISISRLRFPISWSDHAHHFSLSGVRHPFVSPQC